MDSNQAPNETQNFDAGTWEKTGLKPFGSSPVKFSLPNNESSNCSPHLMIESQYKNGFESGLFCKEYPHRGIFPDSTFYSLYKFNPEVNSIPEELILKALEIFNNLHPKEDGGYPEENNEQI